MTVLFLSSCVKDLGEKYTRGNLEIYFTEGMKGFVEPLADYFEDNGLIFDHPHSVQLTSTTMGEEDQSIILRMVVAEDKELIPADKVHNIDLLEDDLRKEIFEGANFRIAVCNANFVEFEKE